MSARAPDAATEIVVEDGRLARSRRTRQAVVDALIALLEEGDLRPTAARVAARAGVSLRTVYQHFDDLEALFATVAERQSELLGSLPPLPKTRGALSWRIVRYVRWRAQRLERVAPMRRAAVLQEPFSRVVHERLDQLRAMAREELATTFAPELERLPPRLRREALAALRATTAWEAWENLRVEQRLTVVEARRIVERTIRAILNDALAHAAGPSAGKPSP
jgi:TetR/AcrR family transcriptional regulator of autoinduction and epiphytic fitness